MVIFIVVCLLVFVIYRFWSSLERDKNELKISSLENKFAVIINQLNKAAYDGRGDIIPDGQRGLHIYEKDTNQMIYLNYSTGSLTITWKYKYFQKEVVHERQFDDVRNLSIFEQQNIVERYINEMYKVLEQHQIDVLDFADINNSINENLNKMEEEFLGLKEQYPTLITVLSNGIEGQVNITNDSPDYFKVIHGGEHSYSTWSVSRQPDGTISITLNSKIFGQTNNLSWSFDIKEDEYTMLDRIKEDTG